MRIAIDMAFYNRDFKYRSLMLEMLSLLASQNPGHQFIFICNKEWQNISIPHDNVTQAVLPGKFNNRLSVTWWYNVKLSFALRKYKADTLLALNGVAGLTISMPQILVIKDLVSHKGATSLSTFGLYRSKKAFLRYLKKAAAIVTHTQFIKSELTEKFNTSPAKIEVAEIGASPFYQPIASQQKDAVKEQYSQGFEYLLLPADRCQSDDLLYVLKAFSIFKKRQKTNMKLLVAGDAIVRNKGFDEKLKSYKYKNDVFFIHPADNDWPLIVAGAYALVCASLYGDFVVEVLQAMQCNVPVILSAGGSNEEIAADAALFVKAGESEDLADKMKIVYKDEQLRNKLIAQGSQRAKQFNPGKATAVLWRAILQAVSK